MHEMININKIFFLKNVVLTWSHKSNYVFSSILYGGRSFIKVRKVENSSPSWISGAREDQLMIVTYYVTIWTARYDIIS